MDNTSYATGVNTLCKLNAVTYQMPSSCFPVCRKKKIIISNVFSRFQPTFCQSQRNLACYFTMTASPQRHSFHPRGSSKEAACLFSQPKLLCPHQCLPFFPLHAELAMPPYPASAYIPWAFAYRQRKETLSHSYRAFSHDQNSWVLHCFHNHKRSASTEHSLSFFSDWFDSSQLSVVMVSTISCPLASPPLTN